jgi:hypothetical protein
MGMNRDVRQYTSGLFRINDALFAKAITAPGQSASRPADDREGGCRISQTVLFQQFEQPRA